MGTVIVQQKSQGGLFDTRPDPQATTHHVCTSGRTYCNTSSRHPSPGGERSDLPRSQKRIIMTGAHGHVCGHGCDLSRAAASVPQLAQSTARPSNLLPWSPRVKNQIPTESPHTPRGRPPWYYPTQWSPAAPSRNASTHGGHGAPRSHTPTEDWLPHLYASQFPKRCERYLLIEDDLRGQGFGFSVEFYVASLLMAVSEQRVLLEVPVDPAWRPRGSNETLLRWNTSAKVRMCRMHRTPTRTPPL